MLKIFRCKLLSLTGYISPEFFDNFNIVNESIRNTEELWVLMRNQDQAFKLNNWIEKNKFKGKKYYVIFAGLFLLYFYIILI